MTINTDLIQQSLPFLWQGTLITLKIAACSCLLGIFLGIMLGIGQTRKNIFLKGFVAIYTTIIRGTPMLIQIFFMKYVLLPLLGINMPALYAAILAIGINSGAYISQIIRSGILSVNRGQLEAAKTLGFSHWQTIYYIVLPQAIRMVLPALGNEFITLIKDSSLASTIGVMELFKEGSAIISRTYDPFTVYTTVAFIYLIMTTLLTIFINYVERRMNSHARA